MRLHNRRRDSDLSALKHLVVIVLQGQLLGLVVAVGDGALAGRLAGGLVVVQPDAGLLAHPIHLNPAH